MRSLLLLLALGACAGSHASQSSIGTPCPASAVGCQPAYQQMDIVPPPKTRRRTLVIPAAMLESELGAKSIYQGDLVVCR